MLRGTLVGIVILAVIVLANVIPGEAPNVSAQEASKATPKPRRFADILKVGDYFEFHSRGGNVYSLHLLDAEKTGALIQLVLDNKKIVDELGEKTDRTEAESTRLIQARNFLGQLASKRPHRVVEIGEDFLAYDSVQGPKHRAIVYLPMRQVFSIEQPTKAAEADFWPVQSRPLSRSGQSNAPYRVYGGIK